MMHTNELTAEQREFVVKILNGIERRRLANEPATYSNTAPVDYFIFDELIDRIAVLEGVLHEVLDEFDDLKRSIKITTEKGATDAQNKRTQIERGRAQG